MKRKILALFIPAIMSIFMSCIYVTDNSEHTATLNVLNLTGEQITVKFIPGDSQALFKEWIIEDIPSIDKDDAILSKSFSEIIDDDEENRYGRKIFTFVPGKYLSDINNNVEYDVVSAVLYQDDTQLSRRNNTTFNLYYNANPEINFIVINTKLKAKISSNVRNELFASDDMNIRNALYSIYPYYYNNEDGTYRISSSCTGTPAEIISKIKLLESIESLVDTKESYIVLVN